jgi:hypothetical protein
MAQGYKVRLGDGSEIGPMDLATLRGWFVQGLISKDSAVMLPGSSRWTTLGQTSEFRGFGGTSSSGGSSASSRSASQSSRPTSRPSATSRSTSGPRSRTVVAAARDVPWAAIAGGLALAVAGGAAYYFLVPSAAERAVREWSAPEKAFTDDATGVTISPPAPWVLLKAGQPLVSAPPEAKAVLANPKRGAFAYIVAERGGPSPDGLIDQLLLARRLTLPALTESGRSDRAWGKTTLRQALAAWESGGARFQDVTLAGSQSGTAFALVGWEPDHGGPPQEVLRLAEGLSVGQPKVNGLDEALEAATREAPQLTAAAARFVMSQSAAHVLEPDETFRRSLQYVNGGTKLLPPKDRQEMTELTRSLYDSVAPRDRQRMAAYLDRVRAKQQTSAQDNRQYRELMKTAVLKLLPAKRERLQALYEAAILKGVVS